MKKIGLLCGGQSAEHEVSLVSAKNIFDAIDKTQYEVILIGISRSGEWYYCEKSDWLPSEPGNFTSSVEENGVPLAVLPGKNHPKLIFIDGGASLEVDVIFPIVHGTCGEDGTLQGLLTLMNIPYVGPDTLGSAVGMDKDVMKRLFIAARIKTAKYLSFLSHEREGINYGRVFDTLGSPVFVKPANLGSSVGISRAHTKDELQEAIDHAFEFDNKILIEEAIKGRELECAVLGNEMPNSSTIGEVSGCDGFYSYKAKYLDEKGAILTIPAELDEETKNRIRSASVDTFKALGCEGLSRVDVFLTDNDEIYVNEINTLPGFTKISMYPSLWNESGIKYPELIHKLIELAIARFERESSLKKTR